MVLYDFLNKMLDSVINVCIYKFYECDYFDDTFIEQLYVGPIENVPFDLLHLESSVYFINKTNGLLIVGVEA